MPVKKTTQKKDTSTEEKIKNAARIVFHKKGFAATRTRDISEEAGINHALLNYYFRSKEKLFDIIMLETIKEFLHSISQVFNDENSTLENKIDLFVANYIDMLTDNPDIPLFILSELRSHPGELVKKIGIKDILMKSCFLKQYQQGINNGKIVPAHPLQFIMNLMSMVVFPFIASPVVMGIGDLSTRQFNQLIQERKVLIPKWIKATLKAK